MLSFVSNVQCIRRLLLLRILTANTALPSSLQYTHIILYVGITIIAALYCVMEIVRDSPNLN